MADRHRDDNKEHNKRPENLDAHLEDKSRPKTLKELVTLYDRSKITLNPESPRPRYIVWSLFLAFYLLPLLISIPDGLTYHVYAKKNAVTIAHAIPQYMPWLRVIAAFWCQWGAPLGVYMFALNNVKRCFALGNEVLHLYKYYNRPFMRYSVLVVSCMLAGVSVEPFWGMAAEAHLRFSFIVLNCFARFCMDLYAWNTALILFIENSRFKVNLLECFGGLTFFCGAITATYLYPFAMKASQNCCFALLAVAPTCLLWGLDSRFSWVNTLTSFKNFFQKKQLSIVFDKKLTCLYYFLIVFGVVIAAAGATSEIMMAHANAKELSYPTLLFVSAIIAFPGIYLTGFILQFGSLVDTLQLKFIRSKATRTLEEKTNDAEERNLSYKLVKQKSFSD